MQRRKRSAKAPTMATKADPHVLYEAAVQNPTAECRFITQTYRDLRGRSPLRLREDFCGTASVACHWVRQGPDHAATGVDLDEAVLRWGQRRRVGRLRPEQRARVTLVQANVLEARQRPFDVIVAFNFSYWVFKQREQLRAYFSAARRCLGSGGLFMVDAFGGYDAYRELREATDYDKFTYVWDQARYHPVTGEFLCHIHFRFPDGSRLNRAFTYDWRLWSLPEIQEVLGEAGFRRSTVYWEGTDESGEGNGVFTPEASGEADAGWVAYIVAER